MAAAAWFLVGSLQGRVTDLNIAATVGPPMWVAWIAVYLVVSVAALVSVLAVLVVPFGILVIAPAAPLLLFSSTRHLGEQLIRWELRMMSRPIVWLLHRFRVSLSSRRSAAAGRLDGPQRSDILVFPFRTSLTAGDDISALVYRRRHDWVAVYLHNQTTGKRRLSGSFAAAAAAFCFSAGSLLSLIA